MFFEVFTFGFIGIAFIAFVGGCFFKWATHHPNGKVDRVLVKLFGWTI